MKKFNDIMNNLVNELTTFLNKQDDKSIYENLKSLPDIWYNTYKSSETDPIKHEWSNIKTNMENNLVDGSKILLIVERDVVACKIEVFWEDEEGFINQYVKSKAFTIKSKES